MRETQVQSLGWEDPLEKEMAAHSSTLAWKIPWMEEPVRLQSIWSQGIGHNWATSLYYKRSNQSILKEISLEHSFIGRTDAEAETPIFWPPDAKSWLIWKDPDAVKDWGQEEKGTTENEMVGWQHWLKGYEFEQAPRVGDGWRSLECCSPWGHKESDTTERLHFAIMD